MRFDVPVPPSCEQTVIAAFLDRETGKIDALVAEQEKLIALLKEKRQAVISHAVTKGLYPDAPMKPSGIEWLGDVPAHWDVNQLRRYLDIGLSNGIFKRKEEFGEGARLVNVSDLYRLNFKIDFSILDCVHCDEDEKVAYRVENGDIFFVRSSLKIEGVAVAAVAEQPPEGTVFECHLVRARCNHDLVLPRFLSFLLVASQYRYRLISLSKVTTMTTIKQESLASLPIVMPTLSEQREIVLHVEGSMQTIDNLCEQSKRAITLLKERRAALISAAVTGQIDVREAA